MTIETTAGHTQEPGHFARAMWPPGTVRRPPGVRACVPHDAAHNLVRRSPPGRPEATVRRGRPPVPLGEGAAAGRAGGLGEGARRRLPVPARRDPRPARRGAGPARAPPAEPADGRPAQPREPGARACARAPRSPRARSGSARRPPLVSRSRLGSRAPRALRAHVHRPRRPLRRGTPAPPPAPLRRPAPLRPALRRRHGVSGRGPGTRGRGDGGCGRPGRGTRGRGCGTARRGGRGWGSLKRGGGGGTRGPGHARWGPGRGGAGVWGSPGERHRTRLRGCAGEGPGSQMRWDSRGQGSGRWELRAQGDAWGPCAWRCRRLQEGWESGRHEDAWGKGTGGVKARRRCRDTETKRAGDSSGRPRWGRGDDGTVNRKMAGGLGWLGVGGVGARGAGVMGARVLGADWEQATAENSDKGGGAGDAWSPPGVSGWPGGEPWRVDFPNPILG